MDKENWLLDPMRESNLQLFALASVWISCKIHMSPPLSVKCLKSLGDKSITEQHFTTRDFLEAVLKFEIGVSNITYRFLEDLVIQLKDVARVGEHMNFEACMDIMDLLYEKEEFLDLFNTSNCLAASILARLPRMLLQFLYKGGNSLFSLGDDNISQWDGRGSRNGSMSDGWDCGWLNCTLHFGLENSLFTDSQNLRAWHL
nr:cyclin-J18 isoform X2 [Ipomoea batatas]